MSIPHVEARARCTVETLFSFITAQGSTDYLGERVSQLHHSLQAGQLARNAGADDDTVLAALLHDIGRFIPKLRANMPPMIAPDGAFIGPASHDVLGERYLRELGFNEKICQLVGAHVMAKRYLTAVDSGYYEGLSDTSKKTLRFQGGIFNHEEVKAAQKDPFLEEKLSVRRWDDLAKDPNMEVQQLSTYEKAAVKSLLRSWSHVEVHGRNYAIPKRPTVVICVDGFDPTYLERGIADGLLPNLASFLNTGFHTTAKSCMPSFTNPNNVSIVTGVTPAIHGVSGNFYLDPETKEERMITDDSLLRGPTILEKMSKRGVRIAAITAKDKLRRILSHGLEDAICFSAECAADCTQEVNGISDVEKWIGRPAPPQYSGDLSIFVLDVGIKLLEEERADLFYLTLSDFIQHKYAPGDETANEFMVALDQRLGRLEELGAIVAVTGDHGMSDKSNADGSPNVLLLQDKLEEKWGRGTVRVICPITDPFVRHHGALGSFVRVYVESAEHVGPMLEFCATLPQVAIALPAEEAAQKLELPRDREGDFVVLAVKGAVIGSRKEEHDLSNLEGHRLRSHGGLSEQDIPLIISKPSHLRLAEGKKFWRNFDIFDLALNSDFQ